MNLFTRLDRRLLRSIIYTLATVLLLLAFKAIEWLFEHYVADSAKLGVPVAIASVVALAIVLQATHKRVEEAIAHWLNRVARTREHELGELANEIPFIRDAHALAQRVPLRLDQILARNGTSLYMRSSDDFFTRRSGATDALPREVRADDPALIHALLHHVPVVPAQRGSALATAMIWPVESRGRMDGFIALGSAAATETLDHFQANAVARVAQAAGAALAVLDPPQTALALALPDKPSIAVLPFDNLSEGPDQSYFADGAVEEITMALSHYRQLFVIARNSTFAYKGRIVAANQVGRELGVRYLVEGSVRRSGESLRISAQLIDTASGAHLWADRVEGAVNDVFALQDRVTASVVGAILPTLEQAEIRRIAAKPPENLGAYEHFVRALACMYRLDRESNENALALLRRAIELDPGYGLGIARAAECYCWKRQGSWWTDQHAETAEACQLARRAVEAAPDDPLVLALSAFVFGYVGGDPEKGMVHIERSLSLSANVAEAWAYSAWTRTCLGDTDLAQQHAAKAMRLSPLDPRLFMWKLFGAMAYLYGGDYERAADLAGKSLADKPDFMAAVRVYAAATALSGRIDAAKAAIAHLLEMDPTLRLSSLARVNAPIRGERRHIVTEGLRIAGLPE